MKNPFWSLFEPNSIVRAICWTLIHSLWIGLVIALLCGIVIATTRKSTAAVRYQLLCGLLVLFVISIVVTFCVEGYMDTFPPLPPRPPVTIIAAGNLPVHQQVVTVFNQGIVDRAKGFLNQNISIIFMAWLLLFVLKSLKMMSGLLYIRRIRNYKIHAVTDELKHRIEYLSGQMGIRRAVRLVQSELVKVPAAVGWLKPMILLPAGIVFQLTPEQLDGILWHELAHIHRRDYLVNILQGIVETVFFFNPGLLWLSSLIRTEREACCDDMVLSHMNGKANYLEALLSFGYGEFSQARYAMSIGSGNQLRDRLKRMISQENKRLSVAEKSVLAIGLVLLSAFTTISKDNPIVKNFAVKLSGKPGKVVTKTMAVSMRQLPAAQRVNDGKPGVRVKDTSIPTDTSVRFTSVLFQNNDADPANADIRAMDDKGNKYHFVTKDNKIISMEVNGTKVDDDKLSLYDYIVEIIERELAEKRYVRDEDRARFKAMEPMAKRQVMKHQLMKDSLKILKLTEPKYVKGDEPKLKAMKAMKMQERMHDDSIGYAGQVARVQRVIADLLHDKVVANADAVKWFGLSNTEFIVNGQKQPDEMQQQYKAKYGIHDGWGLFYGPVKMTGMGVFIDHADMSYRGGPRGPKPPKMPKSPSPRYKGKIALGSVDTVSLNNQKPVERQQLFANGPNAKSRYIQQGQQRMLEQQAAFTDKYDALNEKERLIQISKKSWPQLQNIPSRGIDLGTPVNAVVADLVDAGIIGDKSDLIKFNLTNSALMVNGRKQPEELHQKLRLKYLGAPEYSSKDDFRADANFGLHYNAITGEMGIGVTNGPDSP